MKHAVSKTLGSLAAAALMLGAGATTASAAPPAPAAPAPAAAPAAPAPAPAATAPTASPNALVWSPTFTTSDCSVPVLTQPFLSFGDGGSYTLAPGQTPDSFNGSGWILGGGAGIVATTLQDGSTGSVLDMPSGSYAISPEMCVTSADPTGKALVQDVGSPGSLDFGIAYEASPSWTAQALTDVSGSWSLSDPLNLNPANTPGWQIVRFGFFATGNGSHFQLYNVYVDPRMMG